jgi:hypothetical protein
VRCGRRRSRRGHQEREGFKLFEDVGINGGGEDNELEDDPNRPDKIYVSDLWAWPEDSPVAPVRLLEQEPILQCWCKASSCSGRLAKAVVVILCSGLLRSQMRLKQP